MLSHRVIFHGRRVCHARKPACGACTLARDCPSYGTGPTDPVAAAALVKGPRAAEIVALARAELMRALRGIRAVGDAAGGRHWLQRWNRAGRRGPVAGVAVRGLPGRRVDQIGTPAARPTPLPPRHAAVLHRRATRGAGQIGPAGGDQPVGVLVRAMPHRAAASCRRFADEAGDRGPVVLGVVTGDSWSRGRVRGEPTSASRFPAVFDPDKQLLRALGRNVIAGDPVRRRDGQSATIDTSGALTLDKLRVSLRDHLGVVP